MMKKIIVFVVVFVFVGCSVKNIRNISPIQQAMLDSISLQKEMKTYSLKIPESWYTYKEVHGHIMHSPKVMQNRSDNFYENNFYVTELFPTETKAKSIKSLFEYYHKKMKGFYPKVSFIPQKLKHSKYGEYYLIKYGTSWTKKMLFTNIDVLFHYKNRNFELSYISENKYYDEFISDVEQIVKSFKIKE
jgi:hypothetical protein